MYLPTLNFVTLKFFPYAEAPQFLESLDHFLSFGLSDDIPEAHSRNPAAIGRAMTAYLWEVVRHPDFVPDFNLRLEGQPLWYLRRDGSSEDGQSLWTSLQQRLDGASPSPPS
jgi:hypothetical protein